MYCMKCGREAEMGQSFCPECLQEMDRYPVKPGTPVNLHKRREVPQKKVVKRRTVPPEEQIRKLKRRVRRLTVALLVALLLIAALAVPTVTHLTEGRLRPGQNYSVITDTLTPKSDSPNP